MTWKAMRPLSLLLLVAGAVGSLGGCRSSVKPDAIGTTVGHQEQLHGRVKECGEGQCFTFEGVESSLLGFSLVADDGSFAAPLPRLTDPEGQPVDLTPYVRSPEGAATMKVSEIPLRRTGLYKVTTENQVPGFQVYYRFQHALTFPPIEDLRARLTPERPTPIYVSAPRGGQIVFRISPLKGSGLEPDVQSVIDPWGGRALDVTQLPPGTPVPMVGHLQDGSMVLQFHAPRPGVYTVMASAKPCRAGDAGIFAHVAPAGSCYGNVWHTDAPCTSYGMPGEVATTGSLPDRPVAMR